MSPEIIVRAPASQFTSAREEESLFARDDDDVLIRKEKETRDRFREVVTVVIDGYEVKVPKAVPKTDPQGNLVRDPDGGPAPRTTTIYDAATQLFNEARWPQGELARRIPILCHQPHQNPVAVCRMCSVQISNPKKGRPERKLLPACQHPVEDGMAVTTRCGGDDGYNPEKKGEGASAEDKTAAKDALGYAAEVKKSVCVLTELLLADHRHEPLSPIPEEESHGKDVQFRDGRFRNELEDVADTLGVAGPRRLLPRNPGGEKGRNALNAHSPDEEGDPRYPRARRLELPIVAQEITPEDLPDPAANSAWESWNQMIDEKFPYSSRTVVVDHDRCILCDRCVRACSEDRPFRIIGHTGKGYNTRISFDLDRIMSDSECVQCGQCMTYCPTGALSLRRRVQPRAWEDSPAAIPQNPSTHIVADSDFLTAEEVRDIWLYYVPPGQAPDQGRVIFPFRGVPFAYLKWNEGAVRRHVVPAGERKVLAYGGGYGTTAFLLTGTGKLHLYQSVIKKKTPGVIGKWLGLRESENVVEQLGPFILTMPATALVTGEMAPLTQKPRTATIELEAEPDEPALGLVEVEPGVFQARPDPRAPRDVVVYEITRNMLDMMQRSGTARKDVETVYTPRAIWACLNSSSLFKDGLTPEDRQTARQFLESVNRPQEWVKNLTDPQVRGLWKSLFRLDRIMPGEPVTALGYDAREALARLAETKWKEIGLDDAKHGKTLADEIRRRSIRNYIENVSPAGALLSLEALVGLETVGRWFPNSSPNDRKPGTLLAFLLLPPPPGSGGGLLLLPAGLDRAALELLLRLNPVQLRRVDRDEAIVTQDDPASDFYMIRLGFVRVQAESGGVASPINHLQANDVFGEAALLAYHRDLRGPGAGPRRAQRRLASVVALDPTEVIRIRGPIFYLLCAHVPDVEKALVTRVLEIREQMKERAVESPEGARLRAEDARRPEYLQLGLFQGQKLLALDLLSCTRCDECTRGCADSHAPMDKELGSPTGNPRMLREGMRFGDFLIAASCRSCHRPYCMEGCPVDAIHRVGTRLEVLIESHCIGCGLCERNCPYGSIYMVPKGVGQAATARRAVNCDLCGDFGSGPFCVSSCPHHAAFRVTGDQLLETVLSRMTQKK